MASKGCPLWLRVKLANRLHYRLGRLAWEEISRDGHDPSLIWAGKEAVVALRRLRRRDPSHSPCRTIVGTLIKGRLASSASMARMWGHSPPPRSGVGRNGSQLRQNRGRSLAMRLLVASRTQGSQATSVAPARINSHMMSILLGRDQDGRRLRRSDPTRQSGRPMSETSDAALTIEP